jgi:SH3 domain protein
MVPSVPDMGQRSTPNTLDREGGNMGNGVCLALLATAMQVLLATTLWARTMYVTDTFEIVVRSEKDTNTGRNIIRLLPTGTQVEVSEMDDSWATIQLSDGRTGYVLKRYLITRVPYQETAARLQEETEQQRQRLTVLEQELTVLRQERTQLQGASTSQEGQLAEITQKYEQLQRDAAQYVQLKADYVALQRTHEENRQKLSELNNAHMLLKESRSVMWFLSGGGVILAGWIIGMITERFRGRRRRQSGQVYQLPN